MSASAIAKMTLDMASELALEYSLQALDGKVIRELRSIIPARLSPSR